MKQSIKERLVGSVIILTAALLILPSLLEGPPGGEPSFRIPTLPEKPGALDELARSDLLRGSEYRQPVNFDLIESAVQKDKYTYAQIEAGEEMERFQADGAQTDDLEVDRLVNRVKAAESVIKRQPLSELAPLSESEALATDPERSEGLKPAWTVQVASFKEANNAERLNAELMLKGYRAYREALKRDDGLLYRVYVGPDLLKSQAERMAKSVNKALGVRSMVVRYEP